MIPAVLATLGRGAVGAATRGAPAIAGRSGIFGNISNAAKKITSFASNFLGSKLSSSQKNRVGGGLIIDESNNIRLKTPSNISPDSIFNNNRNEKQLEDILSVLRSIERFSRANLKISTRMLDSQIARDQADKETRAEQSKKNTEDKGQQTKQTDQKQEQKEKGLIETLLNLPGEIVGGVALAGLGLFSSIANAFAPNQKKSKDVSQKSPEKLFNAPIIKQYASGGKITGNPDSKIDNILARVDEGEFVVKKSAVGANQTLLQDMNNGGFNIIKQREKEATNTAEIIGEKLTETFEDFFRDQRFDNSLFFSNISKQFFKNQPQPAQSPKSSQFGQFAAGTLMSSMGGGRSKSAGNIADFKASFVKPHSPKILKDIVNTVNKESQYDDLFKKYGKEYGIPWKELKLRAVTESGLRPDAYNAEGNAAGLMQFIPKTAQDYGLDPSDRTDPEKSIAAGARLMADLRKKANGDMSKVDMMYYGGESGKGWGPNTNQYAANMTAARNMINSSLLDNLLSGVKTTGQFLQQNMLKTEKAGRNRGPAAAQPVVIAGGGASPKTSYRNAGVTIPDINGPRLLMAVSQFFSGR
jgi:hypothetical protein